MKYLDAYSSNMETYSTLQSACSLRLDQGAQHDGARGCLHASSLLKTSPREEGAACVVVEGRQEEEADKEDGFHRNLIKGRAIMTRD